MSLTSFGFFAFLLSLLAVYYLVPKRFQWAVLLAGSLVFYSFTGLRNLAYIGITAASSWLAAMKMSDIAVSQRAYFKENKATLTREDKAAIKAANGRKRKAILTLTLILNFGLLCAFKYLAFAMEQISALLRAFGGRGFDSMIRLAVPLGISFYTFQTMGYVLDVYWEKAEPEKSFPKMLLFTCFFPQMTQGPISNYQQLAPQLTAPHDFSYDNFARGAQRMIAGFAKKLIIADAAAPWVADVYANFPSYSSWTVLIGMFAASLQLYADFSGYMDIVCGACEMLGIGLAENFRRPYFSKSVSEFWQRWHMTLGQWFKNYIFFPVATAPWNVKLSKWLKKKCGTHVGVTAPMTVALLAVWFTTGLWHGASWGFIVWGLMNGAVIIFSVWMEPVYERCKTALHINSEGKGWKVFQMLRTFILITFIERLPEVGTLGDGFRLWGKALSFSPLPHSIRELMPFLTGSSAIKVLGGAAVLFAVAVMQEKGELRDKFNRLPFACRIAVLSVLILASFYCCAAGSSGGFMYAQF